MTKAAGPSEKPIAGPLRRARYVPRQLVSAAELNADQAYFRELARRHNRFLHGCGVVCGLEVLVQPGGLEVLVQPASQAPRVVVTPGHAISPRGDDIYLPAEREITLGEARRCFDNDQDRTCYVVLAYREAPVAPAPVLPDPCMPAVGQQFSRVLAGYALTLEEELPAGWGPPPDCGDLACELWRDAPPHGAPSPCAPCPPGDAGDQVVLAALRLAPQGGGVAVSYAPRRRVLSLQFLAETLRCLLPRLTGIAPDRAAQGTRVAVTLAGERLMEAREARFGSGIVAALVERADDQVVVQLDIAANARPGPRGFRLLTTRGVANGAACGLQFTVLPGGSGYGDHLSSGIGGELL